MESNYELKQIYILTSYFFDDIFKIEDFNLVNILIDEKSYKNILIYNISYKNLVATLLRSRFNKINGFTRVYDGTRYLVLFQSEKYDSIYNRITYNEQNHQKLKYCYLFDEIINYGSFKK